MENSLRARPRDIREQYEAKLKEALCCLGRSSAWDQSLSPIRDGPRIWLGFFMRDG